MKLGVNIDHVATLRQARGTVYPDPLDAAILCARAGADGITAHLREDRRHIQEDDIFRLKELQPLPLNLEMANDESIVEIALGVQPAEVCLVPEKRMELTTEGGLDVVAHFEALQPTVECLSEAGIEVSLFVNADEAALDACRELGLGYASYLSNGIVKPGLPMAVLYLVIDNMNIRVDNYLELIVFSVIVAVTVAVYTLVFQLEKEYKSWFYMKYKSIVKA